MGGATLNSPRYQGIIPPMVTPLTARDTLDVPGLERLVERLVTGGVSGIFALGTTGEAPSLSYRLRREVVEHTCRLVKSRIPVLVGITDTSLVESAHLAAHAARLRSRRRRNLGPLLLSRRTTGAARVHRGILPSFRSRSCSTTCPP
jgi:hypothetical protein